ncbi:hypothetical protein [Geomonas sp.]|uniref:hypothetical protein n=1 Tax=Geomonas sp. TaxID=2651584 RepID=UPI002B46D83F|nr:hypothetical protein [Geomonas sp.]
MFDAVKISLRERHFQRAETVCAAITPTLKIKSSYFFAVDHLALPRKYTGFRVRRLFSTPYLLPPKDHFSGRPPSRLPGDEKASRLPF